MKQVDFQFELDDELQELKRKQVEELKANSFVQAWLKDYDAPEILLEEYSSKFSDYAKVKAKCAFCKGLGECTQPNVGYFMDLVFDEDFQEVMTPCKYQELYQKQTKYLEKIVINDMNPELTLVNLKQMAETIDKEDASTKQAYAQIIKSIADEKGLFLWGAPGVGKSYLCGATLNQLAISGRRGAFVHMPTLMSDLKTLFSDGEAMSYKLATLQSVDVLVLDDIGGEAISAWSRDDILLPILDARLHKQKLTFFTSNYNVEDLKKKYQLRGNKGEDPMAAERIMERIRALSKDLQLKGKSRRI